MVKVVLPRESDTWMSIAKRADAATASGAAVFVSILLNDFQDTPVGGSVVLYPRADDPRFAQTMSSAVGRRLAPLGIENDGTTLRDNWWVRTTMPTVTVESAYLSNPHEADLLLRNDVRDAVAAAIRDGVEAQVPDIQARRPQLVAEYRARTPTPRAGPAAARVPAAPGSHGDPRVLLWGLAAGVAVTLVMARRRVLAPVVRAAGWRPRPRPAHAWAGAVGAIGSSRGQRGSVRAHLSRPLSRQGATVRRRARTARRQAVLARARRPAHRPSVYDELWF